VLIADELVSCAFSTT